jgi:rhodanese-related sulfurtransferase
MIKAHRQDFEIIDVREEDVLGGHIPGRFVEKFMVVWGFSFWFLAKLTALVCKLQHSCRGIPRTT